VRILFHGVVNLESVWIMMETWRLFRLLSSSPFVFLDFYQHVKVLRSEATDSKAEVRSISKCELFLETS
jgi:hypothetical protein